MDNIATALRQFVTQNFLFGQEATFSDEDSFLELGIIDSTGVLELVGHLEQQYGIHIEDDELVPENLDSIDALVGFIQTKCNPSQVAT